MGKIFRLKKLEKGCKTKFAPQSQIIEYIFCDKCNNRETSRLSVGFSLRGFQIFCDNCNKSILHFELHGEIVGDPFPQGRFNERAKHGTKETKNDFIVSSKELNKLMLEQLMPSEEIDESSLPRHTLKRK